MIGNVEYVAFAFITQMNEVRTDDVMQRLLRQAGVENEDASLGKVRHVRGALRIEVPSIDQRPLDPCRSGRLRTDEIGHVANATRVISFEDVEPPTLRLPARIGIALAWAR